MENMAVTWTFRASDVTDAQWMAELRADVLRSDLERLGRFDEIRVRQRFLDAFVPEYTRVIVAAGQNLGLVALRPEPDAVWLEHFYISPEYQGLGIGGEVLARILSEEQLTKPLRLNVLQGSPARRLYERHGFTLDHEDAIDVYLQTRVTSLLAHRMS